MNTLERALDKVLGATYEGLSQSKTEWVIMGSIATYLQGIDVIPRDIDILVRSPEEVYYFAELMSEFAVKECAAKASHQHDDWQSSVDRPVAADEPNPAQAVWYFGKWYINNFKVEVAHIVPPADYLKNKKPEAGIWEGGPEIWPYIRYVNYQQYRLPVVPLEIQLETNLRRDLSSRVKKIITSFKTGHYNKSLLVKSLSPENQLRFNDLIG